jgi:hypothetical protein
MDIIVESWVRIVMTKETIDLISEIETKLAIEEKKKYCESDDDPPVEVWKWCVVVPWWRIIFEYKRFKLDEEKSLKEAVTDEKKVVL